MTPSVPQANECVDFGYWRDSSDRAGLVTWEKCSGRLLYLGPPGLEVLAVIPDEHAVRTLLSGWQDAFPDGIEWIRQRLNPMFCPTCHGEGWIPSADDDGSSQRPCWCAA